MRVDKFLPLLKAAQVLKKAPRGERVLASLFPNRGVGWPGGWSQDRLEQTLHHRHWVYCAINCFASRLGCITPNLAHVTDQPIPGRTTKACRRGLGDSYEQFGQSQFFSDGGHSFLTMGAYRSKALSVVKPHEEL